MSVYIGFADRLDVSREFEEGAGEKYGKPEEWTPVEGFPTNEQFLLAVYETGGYEGYAYVLFSRDGKLYETEGAHCSCSGLGGQWSPGEVTPESLALRLKTHADGGYVGSALSDPEAWTAYERIVANLLAERC